MALPISEQYLYTSRGPFDAKALVKTYADLLDKAKWTTDGTADGNLVAYNGMVTAVWLNKNDTSKNGLYYLFDPSVTTALKKPDVTNEANWHKLCDISSFKELEAQVTALELQAEGLAAAVVENNNNITTLAADVKNNTEAIAKLNGTGDGSVQKIVSDAIARIPVLGIATTDVAGIVKASEEILIAEDGTMELGEVSTDKLVDGAKTLVLNGGTSTNSAE